MTNKSLDKDGLMLYIKKTFLGTIDKHWTWNMLENIIDYGMEIFSDCSIVDFLMEIIPEMTYEEYLPFIDTKE